jgi:hypothetical protein
MGPVAIGIGIFMASLGLSILALAVAGIVVAPVQP